jgi:DNA-binding transcriptional LysR family regulator
MESRPLRYFVAVARTLSITRAAEQLGLAQPPLSRRIKALEREIGVALFERTPRLRLTPAGQSLLERAEPALEMLDAAWASVSAEPDGREAVVRVGFVAAAAYAVLPQLASRFRRDCPEFELRIECMTNSEQAEALDRGVIDVGVAWLPFERGGYDCLPLTRDRFRIALPAGHRLAALDTVTRADLEGERFVLGCRNARIARAIARAIGDDDVGSGTVVETRVHDLREAIDCVASGLGVTFVPGAMCGERPGHVVYRDFDCAEPLLLGAVHRRDGDRHAVRRFLSCAAGTERIGSDRARPSCG